MDFSPATLAAFAVTSLLIELTPGPNMVYLAILTLSEGRRAGFAAVAGVALGLLIIGVVTALGLSALVLNSPALYQIFRWGGVVYLLWLAWEAWHDAAVAPDRAGSNEQARFFLRGLVTNVLNPKAGVFYIAILPSFIDPIRSVVPQALLLSVIFVTIATAVHATIVTLAGVALPLLEDRRRSTIIRRILSLALVGVAVWLAWSTRLQAG